MNHKILIIIMLDRNNFLFFLPPRFDFSHSRRYGKSSDQGSESGTGEINQ